MQPTAREVLPIAPERVFLLRAARDGSVRRDVRFFVTLVEAQDWVSGRQVTDVEVYELVSGVSTARWNRDRDGNWTGPCSFLS